MFEISYTVKLKEAKSEIVHLGFMDSLLIKGEIGPTEHKVKTHDKGQLVKRSLKVKHEGNSLSNSAAKEFVIKNDKDVKSGAAGSSTIEIINIKVW